MGKAVEKLHFDGPLFCRRGGLYRRRVGREQSWSMGLAGAGKRMEAAKERGKGEGERNSRKRKQTNGMSKGRDGNMFTLLDHLSQARTVLCQKVFPKYHKNSSLSPSLLPTQTYLLNC